MNKALTLVAFEQPETGCVATNFRRVESGIVAPHLFKYLQESSLAGHFRFVALDDVPKCATRAVLPIGLSGDVPHWRLAENLHGMHEVLSAWPNLQLVLDYSWESRSDYAFFEELENELVALNVPLHRTTLLLANPHAERLYARYRRETWHNKGVRMRIVGYDFFLIYSAVVFRAQCENTGSLVDPDEIINELGKIRDLWFLSLNRRPRVHRLALGLKLFADRLKSKGLVSMPSTRYSSDWIPELDIAKTLGHQDHLDCWTRLSQAQPRFFSSLPWNLDLDIDNSGHTDALTFDTAGSDAYRNTYFSIVTETSIRNDADHLFFTEKTCKALVNLHPFLLIGHFGTLGRLRHLGFRTFGSLFDESYDGIERSSHRLWRIFDEIDRVCSMDRNALHDRYEKLLPDLIHNRELMLEFPERREEEIVSGLERGFGLERSKKVSN